MTYIGRLILVALLLWNALAYADAAKAGVVSDEAGEEKREAFIEDVNAKQLERLIADEDYVAVFWCKYTRLLLEHKASTLAPLICGSSQSPLPDRLPPSSSSQRAAIIPVAVQDAHSVDS